MDKKIIIGMVIIAILAVTVGYFALTPQYKEIEMSGYTFEVPNSNAEVKNNTINYNTYIDTENDLNIKTWACKDINDTKGNVNGSMEMGVQLGENMGSNVTYKNFTVYNKSGTYTYYEVDINKACMIIITTKNINTLEHIIETMKKPELDVDITHFDMASYGLILTDSNNNTTLNNQTNVSTQTTQKKKSSTSKSNSNDGYRWSEQYGDYIKEYTDSDGVEHIDSKKGYKGSYNPKTNEFKEENYEKLYD